MGLARTLSTQAKAGGEKHNADRGDNPARARIGSSGFVPLGQYVLQRSVGSRSSEKRLVHPLRRHARAWARATRSAGNSGMNGRQIRSQDRILDRSSLKPRQAKRRRRSEPARESWSGIVQTLESSSATEGRHPRSFGTAHSSRNAGKSGLGSMEVPEPHLR